jgi:RNA polymerase sigma-B factor
MVATATHSAESVWHRYRQNRSIPLRNQLIQQNDRLALKIAHRMSGQCAEPIEDLAQIARIGLMKAIEKFDPDKGAAFSSFAVPYIQGEIQHFLRDHWGAVKVPRRTFEKVGIVKRDHAKLQSLGRVLELSEVAAAHGLNQEQWEWMAAAVQRKPLVSLEDALYLVAEEEVDELERRRLQKAVLAQIAQLPKLKHDCLIERFFSQLSEEAIARRHRLSVPQLQTLIQEALAQLQTQLQEQTP